MLVLGLGAGLGQPPHLDFSRNFFLARKREKPTIPKVRAARDIDVNNKVSSIFCNIVDHTASYDTIYIAY